MRFLDQWFTKNTDTGNSNGGAPVARRETRNFANSFDEIHVWEYQPKNPEIAAIQIVTLMPVYDDICRQAQLALPNETGGFLMGRVGRDISQNRWYLYVDKAEAVTPIEADPKHFTFSWRDVERVRTQREKLGKALLGWYHTHPDLGVFLSRTDVEKTHNCLFNDAFQVALVVDPVQGRASYFCRQGDGVNERPREGDEFCLEFSEDVSS